MKEIKILTPIGMLGYGFPEADYLRGLERNPDAVILDAGSTDPGPYQLGLGALITKPQAYIKDLTIILKGIGDSKIPLIIGSAGGAGSKIHMDKLIELIHEVCSNLNIHRKIVTIHADIKHSLVTDSLTQGRISSCSSSPMLTQKDIDTSVRIVAQMGAEPILEALKKYPDETIFLAGRAYDPSPYAAYCMYAGISNPGIYWHMGKIMECGALCAQPKSSTILATVREDSFDLEPMSLNSRCTTVSVAAHTLYEKTRPDRLPGPGGVLNLDDAHYEQLDERTVRVGGSTFEPTPTYQVKLEAAAIVGYRCICIAGVRDPILIHQLDDFLYEISKYLEQQFASLVDGSAKAIFHQYGKNGVMGTQEPKINATPTEIGILLEITAPTQELANAICSTARIALLHAPYPGQLATSGNVAFPLNPMDNPLGEVCRFSIYHLMDVDSPTELFPINVVEV